MTEKLMNQPLVSVILCVKNGMRFLSDAVESIKRQTYTNFELVVQDGGSTDGSLEFLQQLNGALEVRIESGPDAGIGDAMNKAQARCRGDIVAEIDSDNLMAPNALEVVVKRFEEHPDAAVIYAAQLMIDENSNVLYPWFPEPFDLLQVIECRLVPPYGTSYLHRRNLGAEFFTDASMRTCSDYDFWLRVGSRKIVQIPDVLGSTRVSTASETARPESYRQFCADKLAALQRYCQRTLPPGALADSILAHGKCGIYLWAAESVRFIYPSAFGLELFNEFIAEAAKVDPSSPRLKLLRRRDSEERVSEVRLLNEVNQSNQREFSLEMTTTIFEANQFQLDQILEKNFYNDAGEYGWQQNVLSFRTGDRADHLATPYVPVPSRRDGVSQNIEISGELTVCADETGPLRIQIQAPSCRTLATLQVDNSKQRFSARFPLPSSTNAIRLVFSGDPKTPTRLPTAIRLNRTA